MSEGDDASVLRVRLESTAEFYERVRSSAADKNVLSIRNEEEVSHLFAPDNVRLVRAVGELHPTTVANLAASLDRDPTEVEPLLRTLEQYGLVDLVEDDGTIRPEPLYDSVEITIPLG
jgi:predicted transcriptional regulator